MVNSYQKQYKRQTSHNKSFYLTISVLILALTSLYLIRYFSKKQDTAEYISPLLTANAQTTTINKPSATNSSIADVLKPILAKTSGQYGIAIENIKTREVYLQNEHASFPTASLYKLWVMATVYDQIQNGKLGEDQIITYAVSDLNAAFHIDPEGAEQTKGTISYSVKEAVDKMITISDNYSALLLSKQIRLSTIATFLQSHGFAESKVGTDGSAPTSTAYDMALFLEKLQHGDLGTPESTAKMLNLLQKQQVNTKIPKYLPNSLQIAHKTGELGTDTHDVGIVYAPKNTYIIVILAENSAPATAEETISQISKSVFDYFN